MACTSLPVINNGYITASTSQRVEYECLAGFKLIGNKVIECDGANGWPQAPSCEVIKQDFNIIDSSSNLYRFGPDWWYIFVSVILVLFLLLCIVSVVLCCFCKKWKGATVHPIGGGEEGSTNEKSREENEQIRNTRQEFRKRKSGTTTSVKPNNTMTPVETNESGPLSTSGVFVTEESVKVPVQEYRGSDRDPASPRLISDTTAPLTYIRLEDDDGTKPSPTASQKVLQRTNDKFLNEPKTVEIHHHHIHSNEQLETSPERYKRYPNYGEAQWMASSGSETSHGYKPLLDPTRHNKTFDSPNNQSFYRSKYYMDEIKNYKKKIEGSKDNPVWRPHVRHTQRY